jgi:branched-chain amino acid transport system substrate-binding protein
MKRKNIAYIAIGIIACLIIVISLQVTSTGKVTLEISEPIKIGVILPLTGPVAFYGESFKSGIDMAVEEINQDGGINGKPIKVIYENSEFDTGKSVRAFHKLVDVDGVDTIFTQFTTITLALAPLIEDKEIVSFSATVYPVGNLSRYMFRDYWDMGAQAEALTFALHNEHVKKIGLLSLNTPECTGPFVEKLAKDSNIETIELYQYGDTDMRSQLLKLKDVDGLVHCGFPVDALEIIQEIKELNMDFRLFGVHFNEEPVPSLAKKELRELEPINIAVNIDDSISESKEFLDRYQSLYGKTPRVDAAYAYDDVMLFANAIEECGDTDSQCISSVLLSTNNYKGVIGTLNFDEHGNSIRDTSLVQYRDNGWEAYS